MLIVPGAPMPWQSAIASLVYLEHPAREAVIREKVQKDDYQDSKTTWVMVKLAAFEVKV